MPPPWQAPPTEAPTQTAAPAPAPTATTAVEVTPTALPDLHEGPFVWTGEERPLLLAHYMPWYQSLAKSGSWGWHWTMDHFNPTQGDDGNWSNLASHYTPLTGPYDSADEALLEYQVQLMKLSGIDGVIVDWYGMEPFWDYGTINTATKKLFEVVKKAGLKFVICYEDQTMKHMVDNGHFQREDVIIQGQSVMRYMRDNWFNDEAYLKAGDQPVLFIFGPQFYKDAESWESIFSVLTPKPAFFSLDNIFYPAETAAYPWPPMWASKSGVLNHTDLLTYLDEFYDKGERWPYLVGGAFPGFHDIYAEAGVGTSYGYLDALEGKTFRFTLQEALMRQPDMIQLITWNDYGEGTNIEPTVEYGYQYLEMVQEARTATDAEFTSTPDDLRIPLQLYKLRVKYAADAAVTAELNTAAAAIVEGQLDTAREIIARYP